MPVEWAQSRYRGDRYKLVTRLHRGTHMPNRGTHLPDRGTPMRDRGTHLPRSGE
jgi:hypothetical protein